MSNPRPPRPLLPLEVFEHVVGYVGFTISGEKWAFGMGYAKTLHSCTLVCRDWVPKSRIQLYKLVVLDNKRRAVGFAATVAAAPPLGQYTQELRVNLQKKHEDWIYMVHQVLPPLLPNLNRLEYSQLPSLHSVFFSLAPRFQSISSLRIYSLTSWSFREIARLLNGFPNLKVLEVECEWGSPSPFYCRPTNSKEHPPLCLRLDCPNLTPPCIDNMLHWITRRRLPCSLEEFTIDCEEFSNRSEYLSGLLFQSSGTLKVLEVSFDPINHTDDAGSQGLEFAWFPAIEACSKLQKFGIEINSLNGTQWFLEPLISYLPSSLCGLSVGFWDPIKSPEIFSKDPAKLVFWNNFDNMLASSKFRGLTYVDIRWWQLTSSGLGEESSDSDDEIYMAVDGDDISIGSDDDESRTCAFDFGDVLIDKHQQGVFQKFLPGLFKSGILWCGSNQGAVYPVTEPTMKLAAIDRQCWKRLSRVRMSPRRRRKYWE